MTTPAWHCLQCLAHGTGPKADLEARKHGEASGHATTTRRRRPPRRARP